MKDYSKSFVADQTATLRKYVNLPIIYTIKTESQGGKFSDHEVEQIEELSYLGIKLGVEYLDIQLNYPNGLIHKIMERKAFTRIIGSYHQYSGHLNWKNVEWDNKYNQAVSLQVDIIKLTGVASYFQDNLDLETFNHHAI